MVVAVEQVRQRLLRAAAALGKANIAYAIVDANAVAAWVATVDVAAVRNTQDVDIMIRRDDLAAAITAMEAAGFVYRHAASMDLFLDHAGASARDAVHIIFANDTVRAGEAAPNPDITESMHNGSFRVLNLEALVRIKLTAFRRKDQVHITDLISIGLIDATWPARFEPVLAGRLQELIDTPDG